ncbi:MAG TPA: MFS transporter [Caulobacteraceae bacterium]|nr:MFS transporter [Caulobacteraceae bacterium]
MAEALSGGRASVADGSIAALAERPSAYAWWVLSVLSVAGALNYYDRYVITIVLQPMKQALHLTDTQIGLLTGLAFATVYSVLAVPIARIADRGHRVGVLSIALAVWSMMTAACGLATSAAAMFAARVGVGVGEAGGIPSSHALIADHFPPARRSSALSVVALSSSFGAILGLAVGGVVSDHFGWRAAFFVGGAPGLLVAVVCAATIREPRHRAAQQGAQAPAAALGLGSAIRVLVRRRTYGLVAVGATIAQLTGYGQGVWTPTFYIRSFGLTPGQVGILYSLLTGVPGLVGTLAGGVLVDRWMPRDGRAGVWTILFSYASAIPLGLVAYLTHNLALSLAASALAGFTGGMGTGPLYALIQGLAGQRLRATAVALYMLVIVLLGLSFGPMLAGVISDALAHVAGAESLRWSLIALIAPTLVGLPFFVLAARTVRGDLSEAERSS